MAATLGVILPQRLPVAGGVRTAALVGTCAVQAAAPVRTSPHDRQTDGL
jgi:hypothetical protein